MDQASHRFRDLAPMAATARLLLAACGVVLAGSLVADVAQYVFTDELFGDPADPVAIDRVEMSDLWQFLLAVLLLVAVLPTAVCFLLWLRRAHDNLAALGASDQRFDETWVVASWFVPFVNLVLPKLVVDEIWRRSDPDAPEHQTVLQDGQAVPVTVHVWWGAFAGGFVAWLVGAWLVTGSTVAPTRERIGYAFELGASALWLAAAVLACGLVSELTARQLARAERLGIDPETGYRPVAAVVQPTVDQPVVPGYPPPPPVPPVRVERWPSPHG